MLLDNGYKNEEPELVKLISFAYDLYEDKLDYIGFECDLFPRLYTYNHKSYDTFRIKDGIVWGHRGYANHSECRMYTQLGLTVGQVIDDKLEFDYAIMFNVDDKNNYTSTDLLKPKNSEIYEPELEYVYADGWEELSKQERIKLFIKSMVILGFREKDVKQVMDGTMSAREAYMNIAPDDKKYKQWVNVGRRVYEFENNVAISGHYSNVRDIDRFPFPFEGEIIIDCSRAASSCINLSSNTRKVRLINVNQNKDSIKYANLRNATIDEVIDLSKVDATRTKFGHQKVCNLMHSIAKLEDMDLTLACDIDGNSFQVNEKGRAKINGFGDPILAKTIISEYEKKDSNLMILANADTKEMIEQTLATNRDGIGLVRTKKEKYISLFLLDDYEVNDNLLEDFKEKQKKLLELIFSSFTDEAITVRLFDFRIQDILKYFVMTREELEEHYYWDFDINIRGAKYFEYHHTKLLKAQIEAIFEICSKYSGKVSILVPYIEDLYSLEYIKNVISDINNSYKIDYRLGAMIENLESIYQCDKIAQLVHFISFGLNDLTESVTKKSRDIRDTDFCYLNEEVKWFMNEAIYRAKVGNKNINIGICGEHTNYLENLEFFNSIGIHYISTNPFYVSILKEQLRTGEKENTLVKRYEIK